MDLLNKLAESANFGIWRLIAILSAGILYLYARVVYKICYSGNYYFPPIYYMGEYYNFEIQDFFGSSEIFVTHAFVIFFFSYVIVEIFLFYVRKILDTLKKIYSISGILNSLPYEPYALLRQAVSDGSRYIIDEPLSTSITILRNHKLVFESPSPSFGDTKTISYSQKWPYYLDVYVYRIMIAFIRLKELQEVKKKDRFITMLRVEPDSRSNFLQLTAYRLIRILSSIAFLFPFSSLLIDMVVTSTYYNTLVEKFDENVINSRVKRMLRIVELRRMKSTPKGWVHNQGTEEYKLMKEAENEATTNPYKQHDKVFIQTLQKSDVNGKVGELAETAVEGKHWVVKFDKNYREEPWTAHVMYFTPIELMSEELIKLTEDTTNKEE